MILNKKMFIETMVLISVAVFVGIAVNTWSPKGIAYIGSWDVAEGVISAKAKDDVVVHEIEIKTVEEAKELYDRNSVLFLDARDPDSFREGHVRGAVSLFVYEYDQFIEQFRVKYPLTQALVTYCSGRECEDSHILAQYLIEDGYTNVRVFIDGFPAWQGEGHPIDKNN